MAKVVDLGYTDTALATPVELKLARPSINFAADWAIQQNNNGKQVAIVNRTTPLGTVPEKFRFSIANVANVFTGTSVQPTIHVPNKRGVSLLAQLTECWVITDDEDASYRQELPISAHIVLKVPMSEFVTGARIEALIGRLVSGLYETGLDTTSRLDGLVRGSLAPIDV